MTGIAEAIAAHQAGDLARAERLYRKLIAAKCDLFHANHYLGVLRLQCGHPEEAKQFIGRALKIDPKDDNAHYHYGMALSALKHHEDALSSFEQAIALNSKNASAHNNRGVTLLALKRHKEASPASMPPSRSIRCLSRRTTIAATRSGNCAYLVLRF